MNIPSSPADRKAILDCIKEISESMTRIEAERDFINEAIKNICDQKQLSKKALRRMARTYHKQNFTQEIEDHQEFEALYETITNTTTMGKNDD